MIFQTIYHHLHSLDISQKGKLFERLARSYLLCLDKYNFKEVYGWYDWEYRESIRDIGIDLVGEKHNGDLVANPVQVLPAGTALSKSDVDSFWLWRVGSLRIKGFPVASSYPQLVALMTIFIKP